MLRTFGASTEDAHGAQMRTEPRLVTCVHSERSLSACAPRAFGSFE